MASLNRWNYLHYGALFLSSLIFFTVLLSGQSYWLMRLRLAVTFQITIPLILLALICIPSIIILSIVKSQKNWSKIIVWIAVLTLSGFSFLSMVEALDYEITASDSFENKNYYLIRLSGIGSSYSYKLYQCELLSLFCSSSSEYIGIPYQDQPIHLQYNQQTREVYIQNGDEVIEIPSLWGN